MRLHVLALALLALPSSAQVVVFSDSFESGLSNWNATGLWNPEDALDACTQPVTPLPDGTKCAYYGRDFACDFETGAPNMGELTLITPVLLPLGHQRITLRTWMYQDTESCGNHAGTWDMWYVEISQDQGANWNLVGTNCHHLATGPRDVWNPQAIDITSYQGTSILLRFRFDTIDDWANFLGGVWFDDVKIVTESGTTFCTTTCPCTGPYNAQYGLMHEGGVSGCNNSRGTAGELAGDGATVVWNDQLTLRARLLPPDTVAVLLQSDGFFAGAFTGDGTSCVSSPAIRIGTRTASAGTVSFPAPGSPPLSVAASVPPTGVTRHYQVLYRDALPYCTPARFNATNGYSIAWSP